MLYREVKKPRTQFYGVRGDVTNSSTRPYNLITALLHYLLHCCTLNRCGRLASLGKTGCRQLLTG